MFRGAIAQRGQQSVGLDGMSQSSSVLWSQLIQETGLGFYYFSSQLPIQRDFTYLVADTRDGWVWSGNCLTSLGHVVFGQVRKEPTSPKAGLKRCGIDVYS